MKTLDDYTVVVQPTGPRTWWAYVPAIPGCHAIGDTAKEAREELQGVFQMWVEMAEEDGIELPEDVKELIPVAS